MKRTHIAAAAAAAACLAIPGIANAHEGAVCVKPDGTYDVTFNSDGPIRSIVPAGPDAVRFTWVDGYSAVMPNTGPCAPQPTPAPVPPTPEVTPQPEPQPSPTCAELRVSYPNAGPKRWEEWGCPAPPRKRTPPPHRTPRVLPIDCSFAKAHFAPRVAKALLTRRGISTGCFGGIVKVAGER